MNPTKAYQYGPAEADRTLVTPSGSRPFLAFSSERVGDGLWVLFIFVASGSTEWFGIGELRRYVWLVADLVVLVFLLRDYRPFLSIAMQNKILMCWPALACLSMLWSDVPSLSVYHGLQLLMTIMVGFSLCLNSGRPRILKVIFTALLLILVTSVYFIFLDPAAGIDRNGNWRGAFSHKNQLGSMMTFLSVTSACLLLYGWRPLLTFFVMIAAIAVLVMSDSATALIANVFAFSAIVAAVGLRQGRSAFSLGLGVLSIVAAMMLLVMAIKEINLLNLILGIFGKDSTLTGRTLIWDYGLDAFASRPWLGFGYKTFWTKPDALALTHAVGIDVWTFHNNFIETAVAFGVIGPILLIAGLLAAYIKTLRKFFRELTYTTLWSVLLVILITFAAIVETPLLNNHSVLQLLFAVAVASRNLPEVAVRSSDRGREQPVEWLAR